MSEWISSSLGELVTFQKGRKVDTSPFPLSGYEHYLGAGSLSGAYDGYASSLYSVKADEKDILMLWDGERSGLCCHGLNGVVSSTVCKLTPKNNIRSDFLYYFLANKFEWIQNRRTGTGVPHVPKDIGRILNVRYPKCLDTQQKIADFLGSIDKSISGTNTLIRKYKKIKKGMMLDLFTRGVDANGKLRPSYEKAPYLYQVSPIGIIPKNWFISSVDKLLAPVANSFRSGPFGSSLLKSELVEDGIPFLGIDNIHTEYFNDTFKRFVSEKKFNELKRYAVRPKDVVITIMGTVGRAAVLPPDIGLALSSKHLWTMTFDQALIIPELVCWQLNYSPWVRAWFRKETQGGIMDAIQSKTLKSLILPLPSMDEQNLIYEKYSVIAEKIQAEEKNLEKLLKEKEGLLNDLLIGKVHVQTKQKCTEAPHV